MQTLQKQTVATSPHAQLRILGLAPWLWLTILAGQFIVVQALAGVQYGDGARNLYWAMQVTDQPGFLLGAPDPHSHIDGFVPDPPELAPAGFATLAEATFHRWWGPVPVVLMALVWWATGSLTLLALVVPAAAAGSVLATFGLGRWLFDARTGLLAAALVALTPLFYQSAVVSYSEAISTLFLVLALWMYMRERTVLAVVLGIVTLLCKMDMAVVYGGTIAAGLLYRLLYWRERRQIVHSLLALLLPIGALMVWYWLRTGFPLPTGTGQGLSPAIFRLIVVDMVQNVFFVPWYIALPMLGVIGYGAVRGLQSARLKGEQRVILASWAGLGIFVLLVYMFTPGASNTPRVLLPSWPAVALLAVEGWQRFPAGWRRRVALYMGSLCIVTSLAVVYFVFLHRPFLTVHAGLWQELRDQPQGWVMIHEPWQTLLHTRQPVTWFEGDPQFQQNMLHNRTHFVHYTNQNDIRYIPVPRPAAAEVLSGVPFNLAHTSDQYSVEVVDYLQHNAERVELPPYYDLYILPRE